MNHLNLYTDDVDLPQIKPRTVHQNHEFYTEVPKDIKPQLSIEESREICFPPQVQMNLEIWEKEGAGKVLKEQLEQKKTLLAKERADFEYIKKRQMKEREERHSYSRRAEYDEPRSRDHRDGRDTKERDYYSKSHRSDKDTHYESSGRYNKYDDEPHSSSRRREHELTSRAKDQDDHREAKVKEEPDRRGKE